MATMINLPPSLEKELTLFSEDGKLPVEFGALLILLIAFAAADPKRFSEHLEQPEGRELKELLERLERLSSILGYDDAIQSHPNVMGGDACIRRTRIPVWTLVEYKRQGLPDAEILAAYPGLTTADLAAAWDYYAAHSTEVDEQKRRHDEAA